MKGNSVDSKFLDLSTNLIVASCIRIGLIIYGLIQDQLAAVKYTDIDYMVFSDAARFVSEGQSPYLRATFLVHPFDSLASATEPSLWFGVWQSAVFFVRHSRRLHHLPPRVPPDRQSRDLRAMCTALAFQPDHPCRFNSRERGVSDGRSCSWVFASHFARQCPRFYIVWNSLRHGSSCENISVHLCRCDLPFYKQAVLGKICEIFKMERYFMDFGPHSRYGPIRPLRADIPGLFTGIFYLRYGTTFLQETYFYHLTRRDTRHNFSPYFYMLYLLSTGDGANTLVSLSTFLPQFILMFATALRYHRQLEFACFVQTFIFVSFNKVCTSQYFLWYLCLLPLVVPHLQMGLKQGVALGLSWLVGQGIWLFPAYLLEFQGMDTFKYIWLAGLTFFSINILILLRLIANFQFKTKEDINKKDS